MHNEEVDLYADLLEEDQPPTPTKGKRQVT